ncbi:MAG: putative alpha/beta hydrolase family esterase [Gammaproteobacteria bacterium]|jgi:predicted alpha/beta hydrolase family esterase
MFCVFGLTTFVFSGCSSIPFGQDPRESAEAIASKNGLLGAFERAGDFELLTYRRGINATHGPVHIYIEGDGRAWRARRPPRNPTPFAPMGLRLAAQDPAPALLWIARPCMYLNDAATARCDAKWWTSHRYASVVVDALSALISRAVGNRDVVLIGHSGGGALATLIAANRSNVAGLITIGSPLDLAFWTTRGGMTPLHGSRNPIEMAPLLGELPQRHLTSDDDRVVPRAVVQRFVEALPHPNSARLEVWQEHSHQCCWARDWQRLLLRTLPTRR